MAEPTQPRPMWDRPRVLTLLIACVVGQVLLIALDERLMGAVLLGLTLAHALFFFRNVRMATRLEKVLRDSGELGEEFDAEESSPIGSGQPWAFLLLPVIYVAGLFDDHLDPLVTAAIWFDLVRLVVQFLMVAVIHSDLRHRMRMLSDPAYLRRALEAAKAEEEKGSQGE